MKNESIRKVINVDKPNYAPLFEFKELDNVVLKLSLFKDSIEFDITGQTVKLGAKTSKGLKEQTEGFTINRNNLDIDIKNSILIPGEVEIDLELKDASGAMTTASFFIIVKSKVLNDKAVEGTNEFDTFTKTAAKIEEDYKGLRRIIIDENQAANLQDQVNQTNAHLETKVNVYNTVNDMKNDSNIKNGVRCKTLGFREVGDGGGGYYIVTEDTPNGCNILKINDLLSAKLIIEGVVNFKQVGGNGWGQNDLLSNYFTTLEEAKLTYPKATSLNMTINDVLFKVVLENFKDLYIPEGVYYFNYNISIPSYKNIYGAGNKQTFLKQNSTIQFITLDGNYINLSDFIAVSNSENKAEFGIVINRDKNFNRFNNITVQYFKTGIRINTNSFLTDLNEVKIYNCDNYGLDVADENNVLNIDKCKVNECGIGIQCVSARNINISKSWIELCNIGILKKDKGNLNITDTYFERNAVACIKIAWGITPCELIKVTGCSFFTDISNSIINYHGLATTKMVVENSYFTEYDINSSVTSKIFEKGNVDTTMKPIFKNCFLNGGITMGITESDYTS
ncbi:MAG: hypothetical protein E7C49_00205 [Clostridium sp.]|nr:hypothetical protein [Clostridium sp.]